MRVEGVWTHAMSSVGCMCCTCGMSVVNAWIVRRGEPVCVWDTLDVFHYDSAPYPFEAGCLTALEVCCFGQATLSTISQGLSTFFSSLQCWGYLPHTTIVSSFYIFSMSVMGVWIPNLIFAQQTITHWAISVALWNIWRAIWECVETWIKQSVVFIGPMILIYFLPTSLVTWSVL